jgi:methionyl-tRNA formyltransferase
MSCTPVGELVSKWGAGRETPLVETVDASSDGKVLGLKEEFPVDFAFVVDFGQFVREPILSMDTRIGCLNIHPSLLPLYRGAAPIQRVLMDGADVTGVTVFKLDEGMDSGPVLLRERIRIGPDDDFGSLLERAAAAGVGEFIEFARRNPVNGWKFEPQDELLATHAPKISSGEERINWNRPAHEIVSLVRSLSPKPGAWTTLRGKRLLILSARVLAGHATNAIMAPGELNLSGKEPCVCAGDGAVALVAVQAEGKKPQSAPSWKNGLRVGAEECLV